VPGRVGRSLERLASFGVAGLKAQGLAELLDGIGVAAGGRQGISQGRMEAGALRVERHALAKPLCLFPWGSDILVWPKLHRGFAERATKALRTADLVVCNSKTAAEEAKRLKELEGENKRLKKLLAEAELDNATVKTYRDAPGILMTRRRIAHLD